MTKAKVTEYLVKINGEPIEGFSHLRDARKYIKTLPIQSNTPEVIEIVKILTVTETINTYKPVQKVVLSASESFEDLELA